MAILAISRQATKLENGKAFKSYDSIINKLFMLRRNIT